MCCFQSGSCACNRRTLLNNNLVSTLNAAMRRIAQRDGLPLLDLETLHLQLPAAHCYMNDGIPPWTPSWAPSP